MGVEMGRDVGVKVGRYGGRLKGGEGRKEGSRREE